METPLIRTASDTKSFDQVARWQRVKVMYSYIMLRTQISLTIEECRALDAEAARTGRSISALIRAAIEEVYGIERSNEADLEQMRQAFGSWRQRADDGKVWVESVRSGARMKRPNS